MIRKLALAAIAAGTMATGLFATAEDASAWHRRHGGFTIYLGGGHGYGYNRGYRHKHCSVVKIRHHGYWKRVKRCWWHRHY